MRRAAFGPGELLTRSPDSGRTSSESLTALAPASPQSRFMADVLLPATSGRAKCRGCGRAIVTGELRFGEALPNPYGEGDAVYWFHPTCAACMRPEKFLPVLEATDANLPDKEWLRGAAEAGIAHRRLPRLAHAERSKSGKARCRSCREVIASGVMRLALSMFEEGRMSPSGFIHAECAKAYFDTTDIMDRVKKLSPDLDDAALSDLAEQLRHQREPAPEADGAGAPGGDEAPAGEEPPRRDGPELAKAHAPPEAEADSRRAQGS